MKLLERVNPTQQHEEKPSVFLFSQPLPRRAKRKTHTSNNFKTELGKALGIFFQVPSSPMEADKT